MLAFQEKKILIVKVALTNIFYIHELPIERNLSLCKFKDECTFFSCNDMNKIKMGPTSAITKKEKTHKCLFIIKSKDGSSRCGLQFKSANQLKEHRRQVGHQKKKKKQKEATQTKQL